jgi:hypothetical protein
MENQAIKRLPGSLRQMRDAECVLVHKPLSVPDAAGLP